MILRRIDNSEEGLKRIQKIKEVLPEKTLIESILKPRLDLLKPTLIKMLYAELEIYRNFPKIPLNTVDKAVKEIPTFDPRNSKTCFQGKAFEGNDENSVDAYLEDYRRAVGTFNHAEWGNATILEIWGGDHFKDYSKMVTQAFKYGSNIIDTRPVLKFHVNPLFMNEKSGRTKLTKEQKEYKRGMDELLAKAIVFGVKEPKRRR